MKNKKKISIITIILCLVIVFSATTYKISKEEQNIKSAYSKPLVATKEHSTKIPFNNNYELDSNFSTHLPIVIVNTGNVEVPINTGWNNSEQIYTDIPGVQPYVDGSINIIDNGKINKLQDKPTSYSLIKIKRRGNSSMSYAKPQFKVKLVTDSGENNNLSLLGMGEDNEWVLNGSMIDKSMMRNYLAYRISSQIMPYTPDSKYCEVVFKENGKYKYEGVYLLCDSIKQGVNRVNISNYKMSRTANSYLVRRDRYDPDALTLDTYATRNKLSEGYLALMYPSPNAVSDNTKEYIEGDISKIEQVIYSKSYKIFSTYPDYIDVNSFVDYFLVNEFFASYDAGFNSTYMYKDFGGKLKMGPVWDFDGAMDNYNKSPLNTDKIAFQIAPWFDKLMNDPKFVDMLVARYSELRRYQLSDKNISQTIDDIQAYIGEAQQREWTRWASVYLNFEILNSYKDNGYTIQRETKEYQQEIYKLKTILHKHGQAIAADLPKYKNNTMREVNDTQSGNWLLIILLLFIMAFFISIIYARKNLK